MGNIFQKPDQSHKDLPSQPYWLGRHPDPWPMDRILPELIVFGNNRQNLIIKHNISGEEAVNLMITEDLLPAKRVVFITHGFRTDKHKQWLHTMKSRMIAERADQTVVIVGWGSGADIGVYNYEQAASNALAVGKWLATYLRTIRQRFGDSVLIWTVGHSLGAHLMGAAGREATGDASVPVIDRITGLDPAGVGFQTENLDKRLRPTDARLVDVIHTDGKSVPYYGTLVPLGSLDFYPNYGWDQPTNDGSKHKPYMLVTDWEAPKGPVSPYGSGFTVSHTRAIDYFIWSIDNMGKLKTRLALEGDPGVETAVHRLKCVDTEAEMGYYADECQMSANVLNNEYNRCYYVFTNAREPWV